MWQVFPYHITNNNHLNIHIIILGNIDHIYIPGLPYTRLSRASAGVGHYFDVEYHKQAGSNIGQGYPLRGGSIRGEGENHAKNIKTKLVKNIKVIWLHKKAWLVHVVETSNDNTYVHTYKLAMQEGHNCNSYLM